MVTTNATYDAFLGSFTTSEPYLGALNHRREFVAMNETAMTSEEYNDDDDDVINSTAAAGVHGHVLRSFPTVLHAVVTCLVLGAIILATVVGNVFVIAAIVLERNLQNVANYLIASLAVADLMVAVLVMPLAAVKEVSGQWFLGREVCDMFVSCDVLCCTSSILHLVAISVDRYWAVTRVDYIHNRPVRLIAIMIALSWGFSTVISIPPLFGWRDDPAGGGGGGNGSEPDSTGRCLISQNWGYTVYSTVGAFYLPLAVMLVIYLNVYRAARWRIRRKHFRSQESSTSSSILVRKAVSGAGAGGTKGRRPQKPNSGSTPTVLESPSTPSSVVATTFPCTNSAITTSPLPPTRTVSGTRNPERNPEEQSERVDGVAEGGEEEDRVGNGVTSAAAVVVVTSPMSSSSTPLACEFGGSGHWTDNTQLDASFRSAESRIREKREQARERKAARTLAIITGSFVVCWLPFFILALVGPFCGAACSPPPLVVSVIGWLGYFNSLLNPVIYTIFNPDFRSAFRKILFGSYRGQQQLPYPNRVLNASSSLPGSRKKAS